MAQSSNRLLSGGPRGLKSPCKYRRNRQDYELYHRHMSVGFIGRLATYNLGTYLLCSREVGVGVVVTSYRTVQNIQHSLHEKG